MKNKINGSRYMDLDLHKEPCRSNLNHLWKEYEKKKKNLGYDYRQDYISEIKIITTILAI